MALSLQQTRDYVRSFLDTDEEELPNALIDLWVTEGTYHIARQAKVLTTFEKSWTLSTVSGVQEYAFSSIGDVDTVGSVEGPRWALTHLPHELAVKRYAFSDLLQEPHEYSVYEQSLFVWPVPDSIYLLTVRGYRTAAMSDSAGSALDLPAEFHQLVAEWALARAYEQQDDDIMSNLKFQRVDAQIEVMSRRYRRGPTSSDFAIGQYEGLHTPTRLAYDWE